MITNGIYFIAFIVVYFSLLISHKLPSIVLVKDFSPAFQDPPCYCNIELYITSEDEAGILLV